MAGMNEASDEEITAINVTPLVDVVLVLLVVLMVTAGFIAAQAIPVDLPNAATGETVPKTLTLSIDERGAVYADGTLVALEVHYLAPTVPQGHTPWDLQPGTTMTNANVESAVVAAGNRELTLKYKDGAQKILVPEGVPIVRTVPGSRADLVVGEYIFTAAQAFPDGKMTAQRIQVSKDGVKPPQ